VTSPAKDHKRHAIPKPGVITFERVTLDDPMRTNRGKSGKGMNNQEDYHVEGQR
jgi:hypothetical protein